MKDGWEIKKLGEVCEVIGGSTPKTTESSYWDGEHFWITPAELDGRKYFTSTSRTLTDEGVKSAHLQLLPKGTVLLSSRAPIGKVAIASVPMYCNQGFKNLVCSDVLYNEYLYWYLLNNKDYLNSLGTGATFKEISKKVVSEISIPIPPLPEQERIVSELDCINGILEKKREQIKELDALAQSIFYHMFGDPVTNEKGWEVKKLGEVYKFIDYRGKTPNKIDSGIPLITARNIRKGFIDYSIKDYISEEEFSQRKSRGVAQKGDLLFTTEAPMGYAAIADLEIFSTGQRLITFQAHNKNVVNNRYVLYHILSESFQFELSKLATGATVKGIKGSKLESMTIPLPPLSLQQSFATKIEAIEKQKELIKRSIAEVETLLASRMQHYFG